jgi:hypothetical protein
LQHFAICMDPLLCALESTLMGIRASSNFHKSEVIACEEDVTLLLTSASECTQNTSHAERIRESIWRKDQCPEIESHGSGNVGHNSERNGDYVPWKHENSRHPLHKHNQSIGTEGLVCSGRSVTYTSTRTLLQTAKSQQTNPLCPHLYVIPNLVHRTGLPDVTNL